MSKYSVVIPCYMSANTIEKVVDLTTDELCKLGITDFEFVLVNDCSPDEGKTINALQKIAKEKTFVTVIDLGKNAGQQNAIMAGLKYTTGDFIIAMDDDMQTHPSQIKTIKSKIDEGYDIVYGYYPNKKENLFRKIGSALNNLTVQFLIHKPKWLKTSSFWMIRRYVRDYAIQYTHPYVHLQGLFLRITDNVSCVPIKHFDREQGNSTYTLKKLMRLYFNIVGFSLTPLNLVTALGYICAGGGFVADIIILIRKLLYPSIAVGWSSLIGTIILCSGLILISLGIVGSYVGRLVMGQTNSPQYVIKTIITSNSDEETQI